MSKKGIAKGLTNYGDQDFSLYLRRSFARSMGLSDRLLAAPVIGIAAFAFASIGIHGLKAPFWPLAPMVLAGSAAAGGIAWINSVGNLGGFFGPSILGWLTDTFGTYKAGMYALAAVQVAVALLAALVLRQGTGKSRA